MKKKFEGIIRRMKPLDVVIIVVMLISSFAVSAGIARIYAPASSDRVTVQKNGVVIFELSAEKLGQNGIYEFKFGSETGNLEVADKKVRMLPMERKICPEAICSDTGWIKSNPKTIVCLPNQLTVSFTQGSEQELDSISFKGFDDQILKL